MISVKVTLNIRGGNQPVIRRFQANPDTISSYAGLMSEISRVFPTLIPGQYTVYWIDSDCDLVTASTDEDIRVAVSSVQPGGSLEIVLKGLPSSDERHPGVICDSCNGPICGRRYKCLTCLDYDLCTTCEESGKHSVHPMVRLTAPQETPRFQPQFMPFAMGLSRPDFWHFCNEFKHDSSSFDSCTSPFPECFDDDKLPFKEFNQMAATIMKNWQEAMQPAPSQEHARENPKDENDSSSKDGANFDPKVFCTLMEGVAETFCEAAKNMGMKRQSDTEQDLDEKHEEPKEKQRHQGGDRCTSFDLSDLSEVIRPLAANFMDVIDKYNVNQRQTDGEASEKKEPKPGDENIRKEEDKKESAGKRQQEQGPGGRQDFEKLIRPWLTMWQQNFAGANVQPSAGQGSSCGLGRTPFGAKFDSSPEVTTKDRPAEGQGKYSENQPGPSGTTDIAGGAINCESHSYDGAEPGTPSGVRIARSLAQLQAMGFVDEGGWLTNLLEAKNGDVGRVLDVIIPAKV